MKVLFQKIENESLKAIKLITRVRNEMEMGNT